VFDKRKEDHLWGNSGKTDKVQKRNPNLPPPKPAPKGLSDSQYTGLMDQLKGNPAAQHLVVGYSQATDYLKARHEFMDSDSSNVISEHDTPDKMVSKIKKMDAFFDNAAKKYPKSMRDNIPAKKNLRDLVLHKLQTLVPEKFKEVEGVFKEQEFDEYEDSLQKWEKEHAKFKKEHAKYEKDFAAGKKKPDGSEQPRLPPMPNPPEGYDASRGGNKGQRSKAKELLDQYRKNTVGGSSSKTAHMILNVLDKIQDSNYKAHRVATMYLNKKAVYWGVEPYQDTPAYPKWHQVHQRDYGDKDYDVILKTAREWLKSPVLSTPIEGIYKDIQVRAALDLAIRSCEDGKYSVGMQPPLYNMLLARLGGHSENETLLTDLTVKEASLDTTKKPKTASLQGTYPMKTSNLILKMATKYASSNPHVAYDLIDLATKVAQEEGQEQKDQKQAGEVPPQFLEHMKKKDDKGEDKDQGQKQAGEVPPQFLEHMKKKDDGKDDKKDDKEQDKKASLRGIKR